MRVALRSGVLAVVLAAVPLVSGSLVANSSVHADDGDGAPAINMQPLSVDFTTMSQIGADDSMEPANFSYSPVFEP